MSPAKLITVLVLLISILSWRTYDYYKSLPIFEDGKRYKVTGFVSDEPKLSFGKQRVKVQTSKGVRVTVVTQAAPMYQYGDDLTINGVFTQEAFKGHTYWVSYFPSVQIAKNDHNIITSVAEWLRNEAKSLVEGTLPPASSSLLLGIVLGGKHGMPDAFLENLRTVGALHVIAASGMNVSFVAVFLMAVLGKVMRRPYALFTSVLGIGFYVTVAGFEPSIVRAGIMCTLAFGAALLGRQSAAIWALFITGYIMLVHNPGLWEDVGFQLSFLSTLGILVILPLLTDIFKAKRKLTYVNEDIMTSIAAQIATMPILLGVFGSYGIVSVLVNALILWTVPVIMALGSLGILIGLLFAPLGQLLVFLSYPFLWFFESVVMVFGRSGVLQIPEMPIVVWLGYYLVLGSIVWSQRKKVKARKEELILKER